MFLFFSYNAVARQWDFGTELEFLFLGTTYNKQYFASEFTISIHWVCGSHEISQIMSMRWEIKWCNSKRRADWIKQHWLPFFLLCLLILRGSCSSHVFGRHNLPVVPALIPGTGTEYRSLTYYICLMCGQSIFIKHKLNY